MYGEVGTGWTCHARQGTRPWIRLVVLGLLLACIGCSSSRRADDGAVAVTMLAFTAADAVRVEVELYAWTESSWTLNIGHDIRTMAVAPSDQIVLGGTRTTDARPFVAALDSAGAALWENAYQDSQGYTSGLSFLSDGTLIVVEARNNSNDFSIGAFQP